jgi:gliding motility-associated-like protein
MRTSTLRPSLSHLVLIMLLPAISALGQIGPSIKPKDGRYDICLKEGQTKMTVTILLDVPTGATCVLNNYKIEWGDGKSDQIVYDPNKLELSHEYDVKNFVEQCLNDDDITIKFKQTDNCGSGNPANNSFDITFRNTPRPKFIAAPICAGQQITLQNQTCPLSSQNIYSWTFGDQGPPSSSNSHTYANKGTYTATLSVSGVCGTSGPYSAPVEVLEKAKAAIADSGAVKMSNDTAFVCLTSGAILRFDGTNSTGATSYNWNIPGSVTYLDKTNGNSPKPKVQFTKAGDYTVTLSVDNPCRIPSQVKFVVRVLDLPSPTLKAQPNVCEPFTYTVANPIAGATYTLNGQPFDPIVGVPLALTSTAYVVSASTANLCGSRPVSITFFVNKPGDVKITSLPKSSTVCANSNPIKLKADQPGGTWTLKNTISGIQLNAKAGDTTLVVGGSGTVQLEYSLGQGACRVTDLVEVTVSGVGVSASNITACASEGRVKLSGSPAGGTWTTSDCSGCIRNDSLILSGLTNNLLRFTYQVSNAGGCQASANFTVTVGQPKAAFSITGQCSDKPVTVNNTSTGADTYEWIVNSLTMATGRQPTLTLPAGPQTVTLRVKSGGCQNESQQVVTLTAPPPAVSLTPNNPAGCAPLAVTFAVNGTAQPGVTYRWNYGDGATATDFTATSHTYQNAGQATRTYTATLTAANGCGSQTATTGLTVRPIAFAEIGVDSTNVRCTPATIRFSNRSVGQGQTSLWDFGDGSSRQTTQDTILHLFSARDSARTFRVSLIVQNSCGRDTDAVSIRVYPSLVRPLFNMSNARPCAGEAIQFTDATVPRPTSWVWRFSDGTTETTPNPQHRFAEANKTYTITLIAYTPCGYDSLRRTIETTAPPPASFALAAPYVCRGLAVAFTNKSNPANRFRWNFGDGSPIDSVNFSPKHIFSGTQTNYNVTLTVIGATPGCSSTLAQPVSVRDAPKPDFSIEGGTDVCTPGPVRLISSDPNATQFRWQLSNGQVLTTPKPELALPPGRYDVKLTVSYDQGVCADSSSRPDAINVLPCEVVAPEAFTPNSDGIGDTWTLFGDTGVTRIERLRIWNRWGEVIFDASDIPLNSSNTGECWDGTNRGLRMPAGQYPYEADVMLQGANRQKRVGSIALIR